MENTAITIANIFEAAGEAMAGYLELAGSFFNSLWNIPMGQLIIASTLAGGAIGLCYRLFFKKKHV